MPAPGPGTVGQRRQAIADQRGALLTDLAGTDYQFVRGFGTVPFLVLAASAEALEALRGSPHVTSIIQDTPAGAALAAASR